MGEVPWGFVRGFWLRKGFNLLRLRAPEGTPVGIGIGGIALKTNVLFFSGIHRSRRQRGGPRRRGRGSGVIPVLTPYLRTTLDLACSRSCSQLAVNFIKNYPALVFMKDPRCVIFNSKLDALM